MRGVEVVNEDKLRADLRGMARAALELEPILERQAKRTADGITAVADRTGRLGREIKSPRNREVTNGSFEIGVGTFYGHMVFGGTSHSAAQPPTIPSGIGPRTAREIGRHIVRHRHGGI